MNPLLEVKSVAKAFGGNQVLTDIEFTVETGEIIGLLGPNGSGKSTLLNTISGFETPDAGSIRYKGQEIGGLHSYQTVGRGMARTFQLPSMPRMMSVIEVAMAAATAHHGFWATMLGTPSARATERAARLKADRLLQRFLLDAVRDQPAAAISGGQKKLLSIVCALMADPEVLMLDEPTAGVHPNLRNSIVEALLNLNRQGMTLVVVEHDMHFIRELCTRCIVLDRGRIVASCSPSNLAQNEHVLEAYLGKLSA